MNTETLLTASLSNSVPQDNADTSSAPAAPANDAAVSAASAPAAVSTPVERKRAGRKVDLDGQRGTKLGQARAIFAKNPNATPKELKAMFESTLGCTAQVAQTYASNVRSEKKTKTVA